MAQAFAPADNLPPLNLPAETLPAEGGNPARLMLARAIHLQAGLHSAVIVPIQSNLDNTNDIKLIINDLSDVFNVDCDFNIINDDLYLVRLKQFDAPTHYPHFLSVLGKTANPYIEQSRQILPWYKLLNEMQMFMHQHEVNTRRLQQGLLAINSLWFWGAGMLPPDLNTNLDWSCDDPILNRFAQSLGITPRPVAEIERNDDPVDALLVDLRLLEYLKTGTKNDLNQLLIDMERNLLRPALSRADKYRARVLLRAGYDYDFELKPGASLKFWRQHRNLADFVGQASDS